MANPAPAEPSGPRPWYAGLIGFVFAALVLTAAGLATAASYDGDDPHDDDSADHSEDDHSEGDESHEEDDDHSE